MFGLARAAVVSAVPRDAAGEPLANAQTLAVPLGPLIVLRKVLGKEGGREGRVLSVHGPLPTNQPRRSMDIPQLSARAKDSFVLTLAHVVKDVTRHLTLRQSPPNSGKSTMGSGQFCGSLADGYSIGPMVKAHGFYPRVCGSSLGWALYRLATICFTASHYTVN